MREWPWYSILILALLVFAAVFLFYFKPRNSTISELRDQRMQVENEVMQLKAQKRQLDQIKQELEGMTATLKELEIVIPKKREIYNILKQIQELAYDSRLDIIKFINLGEVFQEFYWEWPISIEITGSYHNLAQFYDKLIDFPRLFNVENFLIRALSNQTDSETITATATVKTYIFEDIEPQQNRQLNQPGI
jgi:type IV pilus assembly protein PilO